MAKQATAEKRQRRERGSINPDDIINGAFELAEEVGIDNLSMPLLGKHLGVGVTSIYWYFRKKDDLLNAMTDRALQAVRVRHAVRRGQGLARDVAQPRAHHAKDVPGQPDPVRSDPHPIGAEPAGGQAGRRRRREGDRKPRRGRAVPGGRLRHVLRGVGARAWIGCAAAALRQEPVDRRWARRLRGGDGHRPRDRATAGPGDRRGPPHRRLRREQLRVRPRLHPRPRRPADRGVHDRQAAGAQRRKAATPRRKPTAAR